ncbi:putative RDD family membrane protein YckC [Propionibacteriaceae bacterium ES.041]|uniref:RDD family protein n=1 Tax=Enemella evansiae TaxID=2016499 RepID=A0A255G737_9ACTN|nr:RDD family protein [Enemella evansiae]PFG66081.1 putative RDD family membrane protein YckC [Propionibacteriaceae bacterium ES.041]OYO04703.1 RDD family protein [Enemella evansiae]OYO09061.1 RDD family protein [Enemella evansiae]OYO11729.1 RDD family protein [Enemella evansiae]TDO85948.1 putative RDD family membrane protein YckC [Enemella evansiae]
MAEPRYADDVVTGDAVALEVPAAGAGVRIAATLIDGVVLVLGLILSLTLADRITRNLDAALAGTTSLVISIFWLVGWPLLCEQLSGGRSLGKWALGTRVVRTDGGPVRARQSLARALMGSVEIWGMAGLPALVAAVAGRRGQRLGDHLAGTYVVSERVRWQQPPAPSTPAPELTRWVQGCDLGALQPATLIAARAFLARTEQLTPAARAAIATDLATRLCRELSPQPPAQAAPEAVLAAVLGEHRHRHDERLARRAELRDRLLPDRE